MFNVPAPDRQHKKGTLRNIIECAVYNFITAFSGFVFTVISVMAFTWPLTFAGQVDSNILPYLKEFAAVASGAGTWYSAAWLFGTVIDSINGSSHFDNLVNEQQLKITQAENPAYSRLNAFLKRFITPTIGVGLFVWLFGYIIGLDKQQLSQLLQPVLVGISITGTLTAIPVLIANTVHKSGTVRGRIHDHLHPAGTLRNIIESAAYNFIPAFSGFLFTVCSILGCTWILSAAGQVFNTPVTAPIGFTLTPGNQIILPYLKELGAVASGAGVWYGTGWFIGTCMDAFRGTGHFDNLVNKPFLQQTLIENPAYSRLEVFVTRFITPTIGVGLLIWLFGYTIGLNQEQLSQLLQPVLVGLNIGGTIAAIPILITFHVENTNKARARQQHPSTLVSQQIATFVMLPHPNTGPQQHYNPYQIEASPYAAPAERLQMALDDPSLPALTSRSQGPVIFTEGPWQQDQYQGHGHQDIVLYPHQFPSVAPHHRGGR